MRTEVEAWAAGAALFLAFVSTPIAARAAMRMGFINAPNPIVAQHRRPVPYSGGVVIALSSVIACVLLSLATHAPVGSSLPAELVVPAGAYVALGVVDDVRPLTPLVKFLMQCSISALGTRFGLIMAVTGSEWINGTVSAGVIVVFVNAFNFVDVCDGLLGSVAVVVLVADRVVLPATPAPFLVLAAATLGFLPFNLPRARIFLGDAGSHLLGFVSAAAVLLAYRSGGPSAAAAGALVSGVPLFELVFITAVRVARGKAWWKGSPDHFALRLQHAGFSARMVDVIACGASAGFAAMAMLFEHDGWPGRISVAVIVGMAAQAAARSLLRWDVEPSGACSTKDSDEVA
jgi:UDP-GlcNAc:undecaprenyl-phosphate GlcNAc-1-phosphate transferase